MAKVSIIIPAYRADEALYRSIDSALQQTHDDLELAVAHADYDERINDVVRKYNDDRIRTIGGSDVSESIVRAIECSMGEYVTILHVGDIMHSEKLRIQLKRMARNPDIAVCGIWMRPLSNDIINMQGSGKEGYVENPLLLLLNCNFVSRSTAVVRRSFMQEHGISFSSQYRPCEEYGLWFDIFRYGGTMYVEPQCLVYVDTEEPKKTEQDIMEEFRQSLRLKYDILRYLLEKVEPWEKKEALTDMLKSFDRAEKLGTVSTKMILDVFYIILTRPI